MTEPSQQRGSRLLGRILPAAVKLWLHSQLDAVEGLKFELEGSDRQVLSGRLAAISLEAREIVYQGMKLTAASLSARDIEINLGQILRGRPLRLQRAFAVEGQVEITDKDLQVSSDSLLSEGIASFWHTLLQHPGTGAEIEQHYGKAALADLSADNWCSDGPQLCLSERGLSLSVAGSGTTEARLAGQLVVHQYRWLNLVNPQWRLRSGTWIASQALDGFSWDLGAHTRLQSVQLEPHRLVCKGAVTVQP